MNLIKDPKDRGSWGSQNHRMEPQLRKHTHCL